LLVLPFGHENKGITFFKVYLIKHYAMETCGGVDVEIHVFLISALVGGEWSARRPGGFTFRERAFCTYGTGG
jgi:hypothetical protein